MCDPASVDVLTELQSYALPCSMFSVHLHQHARILPQQCSIGAVSVRLPPPRFDGEGCRIEPSNAGGQSPRPACRTEELQSGGLRCRVLGRPCKTLGTRMDASFPG
jgi:hypothetical protein